MPRRKQLTFKIRDLKCAQYLIAELSQLPQLANFDMTSIEISIKENRPAPKIIKKDIDVLIDRLQRGFSANKHTLTQLNGRYLVTNIHLAKWMRTTPASVNKWIKDGLIKPCQDPHVCFDYFNVDEVTEQLRKQKQNSDIRRTYN